jgi:prevent-host-death family protein
LTPLANLADHPAAKSSTSKGLNVKVMQATDAKNRFGELLEEAMTEPVLIQRNGRDVAVVMSKAEFDLRHAITSRREQVQRYHEESIERFGALYEALSK